MMWSPPSISAIWPRLLSAHILQHALSLVAIPNALADQTYFSRPMCYLAQFLSALHLRLLAKQWAGNVAREQRRMFSFARLQVGDCATARFSANRLQRVRLKCMIATFYPFLIFVVFLWVAPFWLALYAYVLRPRKIREDELCRATRKPDIIRSELARRCIANSTQ